MPGARLSEPDDPSYCTVPQAAARLGCSAQTVRNMLEDGRLEEGAPLTRGKRTDIRTVHVGSIDRHIEKLGRFQPRLATRHDALTARLRTLEEHVEQLTARERASRPADVVSLEFTNLRLLAINEEYQRALHEVLVADEHRRQALVSLEKAAADYRAIVEQFHLPVGPPAGD